MASVRRICSGNLMYLRLGSDMRFTSVCVCMLRKNMVISNVQLA